MTDIARLGIVVESAQAEVAEDRLDGLAGAADRAEHQVEQLGAAARGVNGPLVGMNAALANQNRALALTRGSMGLTTQEGLNLTRQFTDVGVSIATGMPIWMVAVQQGAQIGDVFQTASMRGVGFRDVLASIWRAASPLMAVLAPVAIGAGAVAASLGLLNRSMASDIGSVTDSLGLTADQVEYLKEEGVDLGVTFGDVMTGIGMTVRDVLNDAFGTQIDAAGERWNAWLDDLTTNTANEVKAILGFFIGGYEAINATWRMLPAALGDAAYATANAVSRAVASMINKTVELLNPLLDKVRSLGASGMPQFAALANIPRLSGVGEGGVANPLSGALGMTADAARSAYANGASRADSMVDGFVDRLRSNIARARDARVAAGLEDYDADSAGANGREAKPERIKMRALETLKVDTIDNVAARRAVELAELELGLIGRTNREREVTLAVMQKQLELRDRGFATDTEGYAQAIELEQRLVSLKWDKIDAEEAHARALTETLDRLREINGQIRDAAWGMADAFGEPGRAIGGMAVAFSDLQTTMADLVVQQRELETAGRFGAEEQIAFARARSQAELQSWGDAASAARGFFKEGSDGYQIMMAVEMAFRAAQFAGAIQAMAIDGTQTASSIGNSLARGAALAAEGAAKMFAALGPLAFPVVGAMLAVLAGLGLRAMSANRGGGGSSPSTDSASPAGDASMGTSLTGRAITDVTSRVGKMEVIVTADRDGLNAYVKGTADRVSTERSIQSAQVSVGAAQSNTERAAARRQEYTVRA